MGPIPSSRDYEAWHVMSPPRLVPLPLTSFPVGKGRTARAHGKLRRGRSLGTPARGRWHGEKRGLGRREGKAGRREEGTGDGRGERRQPHRPARPGPPRMLAGAEDSRGKKPRAAVITCVQAVAAGPGPQ